MCLGGCATQQPPGFPEPRTETIWLIARGWHTDIAVPAKAGGMIGGLREIFPGVVTLTIGFGDRAYLTHKIAGPLDMARALLPGPGALLVTALRGEPEQSFPPEDVIRLRVSALGLAGLNDFIAHAFGAHSNQLAPGPYPGSLFFASADTYSILHTCNTWSAEALLAAGLPVSTRGVLLPTGIMFQARDLADLTDKAAPGH